MTKDCKKLLLLGGSEFQIPFIKEAKQQGIHVGIIDINENATAKKFADEFFVCSVKDCESVLEIAKKFHPDGVSVGMIDIAVPSCAYIASKLGLPGLDIQTSINSTNKFEMVKCFEKSNVPHPKYEYVPYESFKDKKTTTVGYPAIVKPIDMAGSRGIFLVHNNEELRWALDQCSEIGDSGNLLIEEYMVGPEVSVELVVKNGIPHVIQITDKSTTGPPHFAEIGHLQPSQLPEKTLEQVGKVACDAAVSLGLYNSLGHAEIIITSDGPKMVEIGARAGGDAIGEQLVLLSTGVNFPKIALQIAFGEEISDYVPHRQHAACIRFIKSKEGQLKGIIGIEAARSLPGIAEISISGVIGQKYHDVVDNSGRLGHIISIGNTPEDAALACESALKEIKIDYMEVQNNE